MAAGKFYSKLQQTSIEQRSTKGYLVFDIKEDLGLGVDFGDLTGLIRSALNRGKKKIALRFTSGSYLYTPTLAQLVNYYKMIDEQGGKLCLIEPSENILEILDLMGLNKVVQMARSEEEIGLVA